MYEHQDSRVDTEINMADPLATWTEFMIKMRGQLDKCGSGYVGFGALTK